MRRWPWLEIKSNADRFSVRNAKRGSQAVSGGFKDEGELVSLMVEESKWFQWLAQKWHTATHQALYTL